MSGNTTSSVSVDLDAPLDDIDDLPGFASLPTGAYMVRLDKGFERKEVSGNPCMELACTLLTVEDLPPENLMEDEDPPKPGDIATFLFQLNNEIGAGLFKEAAKPIRKATGAATPREIMEASKGLECLIIVKRQPGKKENEGKNFMRLQKLEVV